jgi:hypothetical protein
MTTSVLIVHPNSHDSVTEPRRRYMSLRLHDTGFEGFLPGARARTGLLSICPFLVRLGNLSEKDIVQLLANWQEMIMATQ